MVVSDEELNAYVDVELSASERRELERKVARSATLRARVNALRELRALIRGTYADATPARHDNPSVAPRAYGRGHGPVDRSKPNRNRR
jgi:anti-sigma factor RsiW